MTLRCIAKVEISRSLNSPTEVMIRLVLSVFCLYALSASAQPSNCLSHWKWRDPSPQGDALHGIAYGNGLWVAVGEAGVIITSTNKVDWQIEHYLGTHLFDVTFAAGKFVAVGGSWGSPAWALFSTNGHNWTAQQLGEYTPPLAAVTFGNGRFVAVGGEGQSAIAYSDDGLKWNLVNKTNAMGLRDVAWGGGRFVAAGYYGSVMISSNGTEWISGTPCNENQTYYWVNYAGGKFYANRCVLAEGIEFVTAPEWPLEDSIYVNGMYVGISGSGILVSTNGTDWRTNAYRTSFVPSRLATDGQGAVAVGRYGALMASSNLVDWVDVRRGPMNTFHAMAADGPREIGVSRDGFSLVSTGRSEWQEHRVPTFLRLNAIIQHEGLFLTVASDTRESQVLTTRDGINWSETLRQTNSHMVSIKRAGRHFIAVGGWKKPDVVISEEGTNWWYTDFKQTNTSRAVKSIDFSDDGWFRDVAYGDGTYVAVGGRVVVETTYGYSGVSTNGTNWSMRTHPGDYLYGVAHGNATFVALQRGNWLLRSTNAALTWHRYQVEDLPYQSPQISFVNGVFMVFGDRIGGEFGVSISTNALHWVNYPVPSRVAFNYMIFSGGRFMLVGDRGAILESNPFQQPRLDASIIAPGECGLRTSMEPGFPHLLERTTDLIHWEPVEVVMSLSGSHEFRFKLANDTHLFRLRTP